jgi:predicted tellurium resistance membrane protein TerC
MITDTYTLSLTTGFITIFALTVSLACWIQLWQEAKSVTARHGMLCYICSFIVYIGAQLCIAGARTDVLVIEPSNVAYLYDGAALLFAAGSWLIYAGRPET